MTGLPDDFTDTAGFRRARAEPDTDRHWRSRLAWAGRQPSITGARVLLRPPRICDWQAWAALRRQSRDFLSPWEPLWSRDHLSKAAFRRRLRHYRHNDTVCPFLIFRRPDNKLLGGVTLSNIRHGVSLSCALGYWIGAPYARQGYMGEAMGVVLAHAFGELGLHRVEAACLPNNEASRRLLEKCGFHQEGIAREYLRINGRWQDHVLFALLASDPRP